LLDNAAKVATVLGGSAVAGRSIVDTYNAITGGNNNSASGAGNTSASGGLRRPPAQEIILLLPPAQDLQIVLKIQHLEEMVPVNKYISNKNFLVETVIFLYMKVGSQYKKFNNLKKFCIRLKVNLSLFTSFFRRVKIDNITHSFALIAILSYLDINIDETREPIIRYAFSIFTLSLVAFLCFVNVVGYLTTIYLLGKYNVEEKFPRFKRIIKYYQRSTLLFIFIEGILCTFCLLFIIFSSLVMLGINLI